MKNIVMLLCWFIPVVVNAQNKGIEFHQFVNWQQVLNKAREENKKIFVDIYATWCGPCKGMDTDVYSEPKVIAFVDENFIAVKVQMDKTIDDPEQIRNWYSDALLIKKKYNVQAMPTYLFLDTSGNQVFRGEGYQDADAFLVTLKTASDPLDSYPEKVARFKLNKIWGDSLRLLALQAKKFHDDSLGIEIAEIYKKTVLDRANFRQILNPGVLDFLFSYADLIHFKDPIASYLSQNSLEADSLLGYKGYSSQMMEYLIAKDITNSFVLKDGKIIKDEPDWLALKKSIPKSYGTKQTERLLLGYKKAWYYDQKDWNKYVKTSIKLQDLDGIDTTGLGRSALNNFVYQVIVKYSSDTVDLRKGVDYMRICLKTEYEMDTHLDTYANVLYRLGRKNEALSVETRALTLAEKRQDEGGIKLYKETIIKMHNNLPIPVE